jgi:hypothetical protein
MDWNPGRVLAVFFAIEGFWLLVRGLVSIAEGWIFSSALSFGLFVLGVVLWPGSLFGSTWFLWRKEPPTLLQAAIARPLLFVVAALTTFLVVSAAVSGHFTLL